MTVECSRCGMCNVRYAELVESPQIVAPENWQLEQCQANALVAAYFTRSPSTVFRDYPRSRLYWQKGNVGGIIGLLSKETDLLEYYVHYETDRLGPLGSCATQVKLWRAKHAMRGVTHIGFSEILLSNFDTIVSDRQQTEDGRDFWMSQMNSYADSRTVGLVDKQGQLSVFAHAQPITAWFEHVDGWGTTNAYKDRRFFISNIEADKIKTWG